ILIAIGLITYNAHKESQAAVAKAQELTKKLEAAGLTVPVKQETITKTLGSDGGAVCDNPASALGKAVLFSSITNGAAFTGQRPVIIDPRVLKGEALILQV